MELLDKDTAQKLFKKYRTQRDGIRTRPELASLCLICGSVHVERKPGEPDKRVCRNCGFSWYRYDCHVCGSTVDGRDPKNPLCHECATRVCTCGSCRCAALPHVTGEVSNE